MTTHTFHPDIHAAGLDGACPRCQQLANDPGFLDSQMVERLMSGRCYTVLDRIAARKLQDEVVNSPSFADYIEHLNEEHME